MVQFLAENISEKAKIPKICLSFDGSMLEVQIERHPNRNTGSKVLLNGWILPVGRVALERVCACSLRSRLVYKGRDIKFFKGFQYRYAKHLSNPLSPLTPCSYTWCVQYYVYI